MSTETPEQEDRRHEWYDYIVEATVEYPAMESDAGDTNLHSMTSETFKRPERAVKFAEHLREQGMSAQIKVEPYESYGAIDFDELLEVHS